MGVRLVFSPALAKLRNGLLSAAGAARLGSRTALGAQPRTPGEVVRDQDTGEAPAGRPPRPHWRERTPRIHTTYLDLLASCAVRREHATQRRAAASRRAASVAPHRPLPAEEPPLLPQSSSEILRRRSRLLYFRPKLGVASKCHGRLPHHLLSTFLPVVGTRSPILGMRRNRGLGSPPQRWPRQTKQVRSGPQDFASFWWARLTALR
ncbi:uncharacterized protein LOC120605347 isoform X2 [Pteropus medius]|nr:uncharacterized protein LOC120605347 isoform X2 [Pteropus giganteus]